MLIEDLYHPDVVTIQADKTVATALRLLLDRRINGLIVLNSAKKLVGVLSLQDIAAATVPRQFRDNIGMAAAMYKKGFFHEMCAKIQDLPVAKIMRRSFQSVSLADNIMTITADFLKNDLYIVPVVEKGKLIGIVTRSQIKKALSLGMGVARSP